MRGPAGGAAPAHGRRREPQGAHQQPGAVLRAEAEAGHQDPRAAGEARNAAEVARGAQPGVQGRLAGLAHDIFLKLLKAKREVPGAAERQKTLAAQDGKCALCGCGLSGAGEAGLCGQRADFAGAVRQLPQREDAEGERAAYEFGEPRGPRRHGVRPEPQLLLSLRRRRVRERRCTSA